jgi:hypothetical protein
MVRSPTGRNYYAPDDDYSGSNHTSSRRFGPIVHDLALLFLFSEMVVSLLGFHKKTPARNEPAEQSQLDLDGCFTKEVKRCSLLRLRLVRRSRWSSTCPTPPQHRGDLPFGVGKLRWDLLRRI